MLIMVTIVHLKLLLSIRNRVTIKTLISRKIFKFFHNNILVVMIAGLLMKLTNLPVCYDDDDDEERSDSLKDNIISGLPSCFAITPNEPVLSTEEPDNSLSIGDEHLDTISAMESNEFIKSSVENLIPIPSEFEGIPEHKCDAPFHDNSPPLDVSQDQFEDLSESNEEFSSTGEDSFSIDNIDYVEASPPDSELVSSELMEIVILEVGRIDDDILLTIKDDILHEKLLNINLFIAKIEALNVNPTSSSDCKTKSSSTSLNSLLEETNTFDNSLPEFETFCFDMEEISSGNTTTHSDISLPEYEAFYDDHVKEISSDSPTTHYDSSLYASFIFDLSINPFPPADRSDFYEFSDELIPFISLPEYDYFLFKVEPNSRDFTKDVVEDISLTTEPQVHNAFPTHPTIQLNLKFQLSSESLFTYVICESNSHYGYECLQRVLLVYEPKPCYIQNFSDNNYSHGLPIVNPLIDHHCCYECGNSLNDFFCYQCTCEFCGNGAHVGYNCPTQVPSFQTLPSFPQQYPCCEDCGVTNEPYQCQPKNQDYYNEQNSCYYSNSFGFDQSQPQQYTVNHPIFNAYNDYLDSQIKLNITLTKLMEQMTSLTSFCEMACQIVQKKQEEKKLEEEQAAKAQNWKLSVCYDDDDAEERSNSLKDNIISRLPPCSAITPNEPVLSTEEPDNSLSVTPPKWVAAEY
nr:hypothetical protein [Tanacetum cinerariifolium]